MQSQGVRGNAPGGLWPGDPPEAYWPPRGVLSPGSGRPPRGPGRAGEVPEASGEGPGSFGEASEALEGPGKTPGRRRPPRGPVGPLWLRPLQSRALGAPSPRPMHEWAGTPLPEPGDAQGPSPRPGGRRRGAPGTPGGLETPERLRLQPAPNRPAAPASLWTWWDAAPPGAPRPPGQPAAPPPLPRLASWSPAWALGLTSAPPPARGPRRPFTAAGQAHRCPLLSLSSRCRKAESEGAPGKPFALRAEGPGPRGGGALGEDTGQDTCACGPVGILRKQRSSCNKMGRRNGENCGTTVSLSSISQENISSWNLDSEVPVLENKDLPPGRDSAAGGKINKDSKQGLFQLWNYPFNEESTVENRELKKSTTETSFNVVNNPIRLFTLNHSLTSTPVDQHAGSSLGLTMPLGLYWPYADGDFSKDRNEFQIDSCSTVETNNGETLSAPNCNLKYGNSSVEEILTDESDLSENENTNDTLLSYFKKMDLKLKPEAIENVEESFTEEPSEVFLYPDFLPPPFNTLDLHKFAFSRCENWKATLDSPESSTEQLITRLLELERLQHTTIQKERSRLPGAFCSPAVSERPSSSKGTLKARQPKLPDALSLQTSCVDKSREKRKNCSVSGKLEQNASKWNWSGDGKYKWNSRPPSLKSSPATKQCIATYDDFKNPKSFTSNSCQELSPKPATTQTAQSLVKMSSTRCLPPRSPIPVSPVPLSFPENYRDEIKSQRTQKRIYQKSILMNRPFYIQKLNCFSLSFIEKGKCSPIDQK